MESAPPPDSVYLIILGILLLFSMFFSASETAFMSASKLRIRYLKEKKNKAAARVEKILQKKDSFLNAILIGNNVCNIALSSLITALAIQFFGSSGVVIATAGATVLILIFGEILPKSVSLLRPEKIALGVSLPVSLFLYLASPIVWVFGKITGSVSFFLGTQKKKTRLTVTEEDIKTMIDFGEEEGLIESRKRDMMHKILKYTDLTARDIMTPRTDIITISISTPRKDILSLSHSSRYSRFPVYCEDIDDIRGILYVKDFLFAPDTKDENFSVKNLMRPALFIFETQKMSVLQDKLKKANQNIAVIIDEFGGTAGIVTVVDLVEKIFGGIRDEFDKPQTVSHSKKTKEGLKQNSFVIDGSERLDDINERFSVHLQSEFYDTLGGLIMEKSSDMPTEGTSVTVQGLTLTVISVSGNRIESIRIDRAGEKE